MLGRITVIGSRDRQRRDDALGLELGLLVGVTKALPELELVLAEASSVLAGHVRRRDMGEAAQAAALLTERGEPKHPLSSTDVGCA